MKKHSPYSLSKPEIEGLQRSRMRVSHVLSMRAWGKNEDPLLRDYDFWPQKEFECSYWHAMKTKSARNEYYVYETPTNEIVCYLSIKNIDKKNKTSTLGFVMDPNYQSKGYGTAILREFLQYYFEERDFESMRLRVLSFNVRAQRLYEKLGFVKTRSCYALFSAKKADIEEERRHHFLFFAGLVIAKGMEMEVRRCDFYNLNHCSQNERR